MMAELLDWIGAYGLITGTILCVAVLIDRLFLEKKVPGAEWPSVFSRRWFVTFEGIVTIFASTTPVFFAIGCRTGFDAGMRSKIAMCNNFPFGSLADLGAFILVMSLFMLLIPFLLWLFANGYLISKILRLFRG